MCILWSFEMILIRIWMCTRSRCNSPSLSVWEPAPQEASCPPTPSPRPTLLSSAESSLCSQDSPSLVSVNVPLRADRPATPSGSSLCSAILWNSLDDGLKWGVQPFGVSGPHIKYTRKHKWKLMSKKKFVSKLVILCWAAFIAVLGRMQKPLDLSCQCWMLRALQIHYV